MDHTNTNLRQPPTGRRLLSVEQFAEVYHGGATQTVRNKLSSDPDSLPPSFLIGRRRYMTIEAAEAWLAERIAASATTGV